MLVKVIFFFSKMNAGWESFWVACIIPMIIWSDFKTGFRFTYTFNITVALNGMVYVENFLFSYFWMY